MLNVGQVFLVDIGTIGMNKTYIFPNVRGFKTNQRTQ